jgi:hypothetical protein
MALYVCLGNPRDHLPDLEGDIADRATVDWTINSKAGPGDMVVFYFTQPLSQILAKGTVLSAPVRNDEPGDYWEGKYFCTIGELAWLPTPIHIRDLRATWPQWGWLKSPIPSVRVPDDVAEWLSDRMGSTPALPDVDLELDGVVEGRRQLVAHLRRERDARLAEKKKRQVFHETRRLACEACGIDFAERYGAIGEGFCEVHHLTLLKEYGDEGVTRLEDLAIVCSNCHRMIHRSAPMLTPSELAHLLAERSRRA